jgi:hypothetical protein
MDGHMPRDTAGLQSDFAEFDGVTASMAKR